MAAAAATGRPAASGHYAATVPELRAFTATTSTTATAASAA